MNDDEQHYDEEQHTYRLHVHGTDGARRASFFVAFDETYEIEAPHVSVAIERLMREIEWGILDDEESFTITYEPCE